MTVWDLAAAELDRPTRQYATPGDLARALEPNTRTSPTLDLLDTALVALMDDPAAPDRLAFYMPPQEGKSQRVSRRFPTWLLLHNPGLRVGIVSYEKDVAVRWGREVKRDLEAHPELGITMAEDSKAAGRWETRHGGGLYCVGFRGSLTGRPLDVLIIDDPVKDRAAAESRVERNAVWDFWENVAQPRMSEAGGKVVLVMTRWHHDDLGGRIAANEHDDWRIITVPAVAGRGDPLGRTEGDEMPSIQARPPGYFHRLRSRLSEYVWEALYQQRPTAVEGHLLRRPDFRYWRSDEEGFVWLDGVRHALTDARRFITVDVAASTRTSADFTVAAAWALLASGDLVLLDRVRDRVPSAGHFDLVTPLRQRWLTQYDPIHVESSQFGTTLAYEAGRQGLFLQELKADADKVTRALVGAGLLTQHRVWWPADAPWLEEWCAELADFPQAAHDDQVDVFAYAARVAVTQWVPATSTALPSATVRYATPEVDFMTAAF